MAQESWLKTQTFLRKCFMQWTGRAREIPDLIKLRALVCILSALLCSGQWSHTPQVTKMLPYHHVQCSGKQLYVFLRNSRNCLEAPRCSLKTTWAECPCSRYWAAGGMNHLEVRERAGGCWWLPHTDKQRSKGRVFSYHRFTFAFEMFSTSHYLPVPLDTSGLMLVKTHEICSLRYFEVDFKTWPSCKMTNETMNSAVWVYGFLIIQVHFSLSSFMHTYIGFCKDFIIFCWLWTHNNNKLNFRNFGLHCSRNFFAFLRLFWWVAQRTSKASRG